MLRLVLVSPKGPLYRKSGIFKQSLRYMPLTLPTLAALIPPDFQFSSAASTRVGRTSIPKRSSATWWA